MGGEIVLSVGFYPHASAEHGHGEGVGHDSAEKVALDELHKRKIDLADWVYVLNVDGYVGDSTRSEIEYARAHGKSIQYLEPIAPNAPEGGDDAEVQSPVSVLDEASSIIHGARQQEYGGPKESFTRIAELWSAYLGAGPGDVGHVTAHDVAMLMILLKVSRGKNGIDAVGSPQRDSLVDIIGYAGCSELLGE